MTHPRPFSSLRARLILLVLFALLPAMVILLYNAAENRDREAARVQADVLTLSRLAAGQQEQVIESARQVLISLAQLPEVRQGDPEACGARLAELIEQYQYGYTGFAVAKPNGDLFCRTPSPSRSQSTSPAAPRSNRRFKPATWPSANTRWAAPLASPHWGCATRFWAPGASPRQSSVEGWT